MDAVPLEKPKDEYQPEELKRLSLDKIGSFDTEAVIYTDGSTSGQQEVNKRSITFVNLVIQNSES